MATYDHPSWLRPESVEWASQKATIQSRSPITGSVESIEFPAERWQQSITYPPLMPAEGGSASAFFSMLAGGVHRIRLPNFRRPVPMGSMRGTPTLSAPVARGALQISIATTGDLRGGDTFKLGNQLCQAAMDCAPSGGVLVVPLVHRIREAATAGTSIGWDRPTALFIIPSTSNRSTFANAVMDRFTIDFDEVYA